jgi:xanthine dehydrogenase accessory factor
MKHALERMLELEREGRRFVAATVVRTLGSTPQVVGARMILDDRGRVWGTLGGGCVEGDAITEAERILNEGGSSLRAYELTEPLAWDTGLVCGGTMWIHIEPGAQTLDGPWADRLRANLARAGHEHPIAFGTQLRISRRIIEAEGHCLVERDDPAAPVVRFAHGSDGHAPLDDAAQRALADAFERGVARTVRLDDGHELLVEPIIAPPRLIIAGGGHVALALARMAGLLDYQVTVIDDREEFASAERFAGAEVMLGDIAETLTRLDPGWNTFIVVATRGHKLDAHCLRAAVKTNARYVGLLGSKRKTVLIEEMLREEGIGPERLRAVHAPIGLDLGGRTPAEIALSVLSEMSQERYGGTGKPLRLPSRTSSSLDSGRDDRAPVERSRGEHSAKAVR